MPEPLSVALLVLLIIAIGVLLMPRVMRWFWRKLGFRRSPEPRFEGARETLARVPRSWPEWQGSSPAHRAAGDGAVAF